MPKNGLISRHLSDYIGARYHRHKTRERHTDFFNKGTCLEHLPREASRRHQDQMPEQPQWAPVDVEEQQLYFVLPPDDQVLLMCCPAVRNLDSMKMLTFGLTLVRHGETQCNKEGRLQGQTIDSPLSETGLQQAEAAGCYLKEVKFSHVFASDLLRAKQTAETIMQHNTSCFGLQLTLDSLLREKNFGVAEGGRVQEFKDMAKAAGKSFMDFTPLQGETQEQVKERVKRFLEKMLQQIGAERWNRGELDDTSTPASTEACPIEGKASDGDGDTAVHALVVTHGVYIYVAVRYFVEELHCSLPQGYERAHLFSLSPNTGLCRFKVSMRKEGDRFVLSRICCVFLHRQDHVQVLH